MNRHFEAQAVALAMPRLWRPFPRMVFFLYAVNPKTGDRTGPIGTGIFIGYPSSRGLHDTHVYAVTAHHCIGRHGATILRVNSRDGGSRFIDTEPHEWEFDPDGSDIAVLDVTDLLDPTDDYSKLPFTLLAGDGFLKEVEVGIGEDGFMLGLLGDNPGKFRNLVAFRAGNVTLLASDDDPVQQPNGKARPSHLFDIRSRPGFSGSPVFVYRTVASDLTEAVARGRGIENRPRGNAFPIYSLKELEENTYIMLLGIHVGQYHDSIEVRAASTAIEEAVIVQGGGTLAMPNSICVVAPAWDITALFSRQSLAKQRLQRETTGGQPDPPPR